MKKLVFAAIAAMVMVSVSNVFATNKMESVSNATPIDTIAPTEQPADTTVTEEKKPVAEVSAETPVEQTTNTTVTEENESTTETPAEQQADTTATAE